MKSLWLPVLLGLCGAKANAAALCPGRSVVVAAHIRGTSQPLAKAEVRAGADLVLTGADGTAQLCLPIDAAGIRIEVRRSGFEPAAIAVADLGGEPALNVYLEPTPNGDNEVYVFGTRAGTEPSTSISGAEAAAVAPLGDPVQIVKTLPGVQQIGLRPEVAIRGSAPNDSVYFIDDIAVPFVFHQVGQISVLSDRMLASVDFYPGGFGAEYGNATGGAVVLKTLPLPPPEALSDVRINLPAGAAVFHQQPVGDDGGFAATVRRSYLDTFLPKLAKDKSGLTLVPYSGDAHIVAGNRGPLWSNKVTLLGSYDGLKLAFPDAETDTGSSVGNRFDLFNAFGVLAWEAERQNAGAWQLRATPQVAQVKNRSLIVDHRLNFDRTSVRLPVSAMRRVGAGGKLRLGAEVTRSVDKYDEVVGAQRIDQPWIEAVEPPESSLKTKFFQTRTAAWTAFDQKWGRATWTPGVRLQQATDVRSVSIDPRLAFAYAVTPELRLTVTAGQYSQAPDPRASAESEDQAAYELDHKRLTFETSNHLGIGVSRSWGEAWLTELQIYDKRGYHLVERNPQSRFLGNTGSSRSRGVELFLRRFPRQGVFGWISYTYARTEQRQADDQSFTTGDYDQTHVANAALGIKFMRYWLATAALSYHTGDPFDRVARASYRPETDSYLPVTEPSGHNDRRLPDFHSADVSIGRDILFDVWTLQAKLGVLFLAEKPQAYFAQYSYDYTETNYYVGPPPIPYVELRGVF